MHMCFYAFLPVSYNNRVLALDSLVGKHQKNLDPFNIRKEYGAEEGI